MKLQDKEHMELDAEASEIFARRLAGAWHPEDQARLEERLGADRTFAEAYRFMEEAWRGLDQHSESPEFIAYRAAALVHTSKAGARRWRMARANVRNRWQWAAAAAGIAALGIIWKISPDGEYRTDIGEQRLVELEDDSRVALDAKTRLSVRYTDTGRTIELLEGQAQFSVAADVTRPFRVKAGQQTVIALGTEFTVDYTAQRVSVTLLEGKVAVLAAHASSASGAEGKGVRSEREPPAQRDGLVKPSIELSPGQALRIEQNGRIAVIPNADIEAATAWRQGKVICRAEPIGEVVGRLNRYSRLQIRIEDPVLAARNISGIFEAGDTQGFVSIVQRYLPVIAEPSESNVITLRFR